MHFSIAATLLTCTAAVQAFSDSSPFFLLSSAKLVDTSLGDKQIRTSSYVTSKAKELLASCPTSRYILVSQPNVHADDIHDAQSGCTMPNLCRAVFSESTQSRFSVREVVGNILSQTLADYITATCVEHGKQGKVEQVELPRLPSTREKVDRAYALIDNDHKLGELLDTLGDDYTVVFFSDPNEFKAYEPEFVAPVHMDIKRQSNQEPVVFRRQSNETDNRPLFEKYQFFTPGIFMGFLALIVLGSILGVGLKALSSLEVSYGAFDKDMGPAAQKKQQ
ncbi:BIG/ATPase V1 complex, subunit S1 [Lasiosphaeria miniovina]|uniref:Protein BIG1 n=1 Tax=Lasiosphaeria miniovina TaxID=1954250 RepID=A0AA40B593_9PEZI|nr:BIG/ATPase V1 complex, subunit S1 [Lasiosphaeria miniovina]KAK0727887.1 BIG/ATPase V1 complex, subunit S1 [Lasiosphaeria miniovina]